MYLIHEETWVHSILLALLIQELQTTNHMTPFPMLFNSYMPKRLENNLLQLWMAIEYPYVDKRI